MTGHLLDTGMLRRTLQGKTALVTGAGKRLGRAIAVALAEEGVQIVAHDRKALEEEANKTCDQVVGCGARTWKVIADLERPEEYGSLVGHALQNAGSLDILVNNASVFNPGGLKEVTLPELIRHVTVNAWVPLVLSREFSRRVPRGKIVNLIDTKISGHERTHAAYLLSKKMLAEITLMSALEFAPNISVNAVAPGAILAPAGKGPEYLERLAASLPLKRHGGPDDVVDAVLYLLKSEFVTGQIIYVDGGKHLSEAPWTGS